ncbi:serine/arginine repetitive matrix protein 1-like isoform X2 [Denticeps clupeoides]|nr:serine/arginine repetitive matrix protein 1-like isoform X2 [Denticeps clupeoides]
MTEKACLSEKMKRKAREGKRNLSQSNNDVTQGGTEELSSEDVGMGSRTFSHDSIFLADQGVLSPEPAQVSQENVHNVVRALQEKLLQQNLNLGKPSAAISMKPSGDKGDSSEDGSLSESLPQMVLVDVSSPTRRSAPDHGIDFSVPPLITRCLDNSAARHRMSVKPRNQRASTKVRRLPSSTSCRPRSESMNNLERPLHGQKINDENCVSPRLRSHSIQTLRPGGHVVSSASHLRSLEGPRDSMLPSSHLESHIIQVPVESQTNSKAASSVPLQCTDLDINAFKSQAGNLSASPRKSSPTPQMPVPEHQWVKSRFESSPKVVQPSASVRSVRKTTGSKDQEGGGGGMLLHKHTILTTIPGSHTQTVDNISPNPAFQHEDRIRTSSFSSVMEGTRGTVKPGVQKSDLQPKKSSPVPEQDQQGLFRHLTSQMGQKQVPKGPQQMSGETQEDSEKDEVVNEDLLKNAKENQAKEEEAKNDFGIKLRSTSLSLKYRQDTVQSEQLVKQRSKNPTLVQEDGPQLQQNCPFGPIRTNRMDSLLKKPLSQPSDCPLSSPCQQHMVSRTKSDTRQKVRCGPEGKHPPSEGRLAENPHTPSTEETSVGVKEVPTALPAVKESQTAAPEVSWMSMAREKTRSLQQLFTSRLPEFTMTPAPKSRDHLSTSTPPPPPDSIPKPACHAGSTRSPRFTSTAEQPQPGPVLTPTSALQTSASPHLPSSPPPIRVKAMNQTSPQSTEMAAEVKVLPTALEKCTAPGTKTELPKTSREIHHKESKMDVRTGPAVSASMATPMWRISMEDRLQKKPLPSSPPQLPVSDAGQPSWMELAKRKSLAWSDKTMD